MKVSIITVVLNNAEVIEQALHSVFIQTYKDIEYIVVDGQSTDGTMAILQRHQHRLAQLVSEPDRGLYDAMNKGLKLATGDVIGILNADDIYADGHVIEDVVKNLERSHADTLYADLQYIDRDNPARVVRQWRSGGYRRAQFRRGWMPPHPTFFVKRQVYERFGYFNTELKSAADYELMLRLLYRHNVSTCYLPRVTVKMRTGGTSNATLANRLRANAEDRKAWRLNGLSMPFYMPILKPLRKIGQFFVK